VTATDHTTNTDRATGAGPGADTGPGASAASGAGAALGGGAVAAATTRHGRVAGGTGSLWAVLPTVLALGLGPAVTLGLARFSYALVLPGMRASLHWTYTQAGGVNTVNALGYLLGAIVAAPVVGRFGARRSFVLGLVVTGLALLATGTTGWYPALLAFRLVAGAISAIAFVAGAALVATLAGRALRHAALLVTVYIVVGGGAGIVVSGALIGPLGLPWRADWWLLGGLTLLAVLLAGRAAYRSEEPARRAAGTARASLRPILPSILAYGLGGLGYVAYMTFIVAFLAAHGATAGRITAFWIALGAGAIVAAFGWGRLLHRLPPGPGTALVLLVLSAGAALPLLGTGIAVSLLSGVLFGGSAMTVASAVTATARRMLPPHAWTGAIGVLTVVFSTGQCIGPLASGTLSDAGGIRLGLAASVLVLLLAAAVALTQRSRTTSPAGSADRAEVTGPAAAGRPGVRSPAAAGAAVPEGADEGVTRR
jgi:predicted MFS family arabinose efflux permease